MVWNSEQTGQQQLRHQSFISSPSIPNFSLVWVRAIDIAGTMKQQAMNQENPPVFPSPCKFAAFEHKGQQQTFMHAMGSAQSSNHETFHSLETMSVMMV